MFVVEWLLRVKNPRIEASDGASAIPLNNGRSVLLYARSIRSPFGYSQNVFLKSGSQNPFSFDFMFCSHAQKGTSFEQQNCHFVPSPLPLLTTARF